MGGAEFTAGSGLFEELVGFVAAGFGIGEDRGEPGPAGVGKDPLGMFRNGGAYVVGQDATGLLLGRAGCQFGERRTERVVGC